MYNYYKNELSGWNLDNDEKTESEGRIDYAVSFSNDNYYVVRVDCIVTGDKDLLLIKNYKNIKILSPRDFWSFEKY